MEYINKRTFKIISLILFTLFSSFTFADDIQNTRMELISSIYVLITILASAIGIGFMIMGVAKMKANADNPNNPKNFPTAIITTIFAGAMLFNYSTTASMFVTSLLGDTSGYCMVSMDSSVEGELRENCFDIDNSEVMSNTAKKIEESNGIDAATTFKENIKVVIALFQTVAVIYFLKALMLMKSKSEGETKETYSKIIMTLLFSALVIDLPHTMDLAYETIQALGYG